MYNFFPFLRVHTVRWTYSLAVAKERGIHTKEKKKTKRKAKKTEASYSGKVEQQIRKWNDANHVTTNRNAEGGQLIIYGNATWMRARE